MDDKTKNVLEELANSSRKNEGSIEEEGKLFDAEEKAFDLINDAEQAAKIAVLNDRLRKDPLSFPEKSRLFVSTRGVIDNLSEDEKYELCEKVKQFDNFTEDNDPYGEHDFGALTIKDVKYFWKIDYYNLDMSAGSEDPSDISKTCRVLTIMRADEY